MPKKSMVAVGGLVTPSTATPKKTKGKPKKTKDPKGFRGVVRY